MKWLTLLLLLLVLPGWAADGKSPVELRAALIFQLSKVIYFPPGAIASGVQLCLLQGDSDEMAAYFSSHPPLIAQGKPFTVTRLGSLEDTRSCALLYISDSGAVSAHHKDLRQLSTALITIGDDSQFLNQGGLLSLIDEDGRLSIMVNRQLLQGETPRLPSRVLALARFYPE